MKHHELKTDPAVFAAVIAGIKTHEIRFDDRNFAVGDVLHLRETKYTGAAIAAGAPLEYTGRHALREVSHIQTGYGLVDGWVILSFATGAPTAGRRVADNLPGKPLEWGAGSQVHPDSALPSVPQGSATSGEAAAIERATADQEAFEAWSKREGAFNLTPAGGAYCEDFRFPATYYYSNTETAWRAWANGRAALAASAEQSQALLAKEQDDSYQKDCHSAEHVASILAAHPADAGAVAVEKAKDFEVFSWAGIDAGQNTIGRVYRNTRFFADTHTTADAERIANDLNRLANAASQPQATPLEAKSSNMDTAQVHAMLCEVSARTGIKAAFHTEIGSGDLNRTPMYCPLPEATSEPVTVEVKRGRVWIAKGQQSFMLAYEADTDEELNWYANQLRAVLSGITPGVKLEATSERKPLTDEEIDLIVKDHSTSLLGWEWSGEMIEVNGWREYEFARAIEQHHGIGGDKS